MHSYHELVCVDLRELSAGEMLSAICVAPFSVRDSFLSLLFALRTGGILSKMLHPPLTTRDSFLSPLLVHRIGTTLSPLSIRDSFLSPLALLLAWQMNRKILKPMRWDGEQNFDDNIFFLIFSFNALDVAIVWPTPNFFPTRLTSMFICQGWTSCVKMVPNNYNGRNLFDEG